MFDVHGMSEAAGRADARRAFSKGCQRAGSGADLRLQHSTRRPSACLHKWMHHTHTAGCMIVQLSRSTAGRGCKMETAASCDAARLVLLPAGCALPLPAQVYLLVLQCHRQVQCIFWVCKSSLLNVQRVMHDESWRDTQWLIRSTTFKLQS